MNHVGTQQLETDRLILRRYTKDDASAMYKNWASDDEVTKCLTFIISELCKVMTGMGMIEIRLGWVKGNPQAEHFRKKNGFVETGATNESEEYTVVVARREL